MRVAWGDCARSDAVPGANRRVTVGRPGWTADMDRIAGWIDAVVAAESAGDEAAVEKVGAEVRDFTRGFPVPGMPA